MPRYILISSVPAKRLMLKAPDLPAGRCIAPRLLKRISSTHGGILTFISSFSTVRRGKGLLEFCFLPSEGWFEFCASSERERESGLFEHSCVRLFERLCAQLCVRLFAQLFERLLEYLRAHSCERLCVRLLARLRGHLCVIEIISNFVNLNYSSVSSPCLLNIISMLAFR